MEKNIHLADKKRRCKRQIEFKMEKNIHLADRKRRCKRIYWQIGKEDVK